jgi:hypothetical protein
MNNRNGGCDAVVLVAIAAVVILIVLKLVGL